VAINGRTDIRGDFFKFQARRGQRLSFDCFAQRLLTIETRGVSAEIALGLLSADGGLLASNSPLLRQRSAAGLRVRGGRLVRPRTERTELRRGQGVSIGHQ
jgi:hypothetical protein